MGAQPNKDELTNVDCGQESRMLKEYMRIVYELKMDGVEECLWKKEIYTRGSEDLKNFIVQNIDFEEGYKEIEIKLKKAIEKLRMIANKEEEMNRLTSMITESVQSAMETERGNQRLYRKDSVKCYECGRLGHISRYCRVSRKNVEKDLNKRGFNYVCVGNSVSSDRDYVYTKYGKRLKKNNNTITEKECNDGEKQGFIEVNERRINEELERLRRKYHEVFGGEEDEEIKYCKLEKCKINTKEGEVVRKKGQIVEQALIEDTVAHIKNLEKRKIIRRSSSEWRNPIRSLRKPNGTIRLVSNLMALNDIVEKDAYELARIRDVTRATQGSKVFTVVDLKESFYHIEIAEQDKHKTAFEFNGRVYEWNSMVMGFKNSPQILQRVMNNIFEDLLGEGVEVYMDDVVIHAVTKRRHDELFEEVLKRFKKHKMKLNISKIQYCKKEVKLLGVTLNGEDTHACEIKKNEALEYPIPRTVTELRRFLGLTGWFRSFIKNYAEITNSLTNALKGKGTNFKWTENMEKEFINLKEVLKNLKKLKIADYDKEFLLRTDASNVGMGAVLLQKDRQDEWVPIQWASKKFTPTECRYGISEKEMYAIYWGVKKFDYELRGRKFKIETDHKALIEIRNKPNFNNNRINRWIEGIQEYDFTIEYKKPENLIVADSLSRIHMEDNKKVEVDKQRSIKQQEGRWKKHAVKEDGKLFWIFDSGVKVEIPDEKDRKKLIDDCHKEKGHRSMLSVYYGMKNNYYWPGMKKDIENELRKCEVCQINNRKKSGGCDFVATSRYLEKVALDLIEFREVGQYVIVAIDYYSRRVWGRVIGEKSGNEIYYFIKELCSKGKKPEEIITDNGKEFVNVKIRDLCSELDIEHRKVSIEAHRSNGRVERVIGTLRECIAKSNLRRFEDKVNKSIEIYNKSYHSGLKCTPIEAVQDETGKVMLENGREGNYAKLFVARKREKFYKNQVVRVTKKENLGNQTKYKKGRFTDMGMILEICPGDSYIVRLENGRIVKKRHYDLKGRRINGENE